VVHEVAAAGFSDSADYEKARPSYPQAAIDWFAGQLHLAPERVCCDLAAGTGKLTRLLLPTGADVFAIEPVAGMRATFRGVLPDTPLLAGTSEAMPLRDASVDAVTVAQAWHWFDHDRAAAEMARVIRPGGALGLTWNARDRSVEWVNQVWTIMDRVEKKAPWRDHENWRDSAFRELPGFGELQTAEFFHTQQLTPADVEARIASVSHVAVLPDAEKAAVLAEVREVLASNPATAGRDVVEMPYRTDCLAAARG
jgi:SAM-dependent methyltransferase